MEGWLAWDGTPHADVTGDAAERIVRALADVNGNVTKAARTLGIHPNYLHRLMRKLGIRG